MSTKARKHETTKKTFKLFFVFSCFRVFVLGFAVLAAITVGATAGPTFTNVTTPAGIRFKHNSGAFGKKYLPETMGSGVAFFDADGDGWSDLLLINAKSWPGQPGSASRHALYHNNHDGTFTDITARSGLAVDQY